MARVLLFSDLHGHPFKAYATVLPNGMNSRLADAVNVLKQIRQIAIERDVALVLFGGDMFHVRKNISVAAFNAVYQEVAKYRAEKIPVVLNHGNHDQADREGEIYSVYAFNAFATVVDSPGYVYIEDKNGELFSIMAIPYTENLEHMRDMVNSYCEFEGKSHRLLLGHLGIQGAEVGAEFVYRNPHDATVADLRCEKFDAVYLGHFHKYQQLAQNAWYIGAPMQHTWGDRNDPRGCLIYDTETRTHERILLKAPQFIQLTETELNNSVMAGAEQGENDNFVRVISDRAWSDDEREAVRARFQFRSLEIAISKRESVIKPRMQVDPSMAMHSLIDRYVHSGLEPTEGLDEDYLLLLGNEIMQEVEESDG